MAKRLSVLIIGAIAAFVVLGSAAGDVLMYPRSATPPPTSSDSVGVAPASPLLKVIVGAGAAGNLKPGTKPYSPGAQVQFSFTPKPGHSEARVVLDGKLVRPKGTIIMNGDHWLWAFGNPEKGTLFKKFMTVPSDVTKIPYPAFYQKRPLFDFKVADPYCALSQDVVAYPTSYLGEFPMPPVVGAPLPSSARRGISLHDVWDPNSASYNYNSGCRDRVRDAFLITLERWKKLNIHHLSIFQWTYLIDCTANPLEFHIGEWMGVPESDMPWLIKQAKKAGLEVYELMQLGSVDLNHKPLPTSPSLDFATRFLNAYTRFIVNRARQAEQLGIDALRLEGNSLGSEYPELYLDKMRNAARQVRSVYRGKIMCGNFAPQIVAKDDRLKGLFDWYDYIAPIQVYTEEDNANLTVSMLKGKYQAMLSDIAGWMGANKKPVLLGIFAQSHRDFLIRGWVEDTVDTGEQKALKIDFSVQALAYEATLEAIAAETQLSIIGVDTHAYWYTDCILPKDSFPNHSASVRNKPAESILFQWFKR